MRHDFNDNKYMQRTRYARLTNTVSVEICPSEGTRGSNDFLAVKYLFSVQRPLSSVPLPERRAPRFPVVLKALDDSILFPLIQLPSTKCPLDRVAFPARPDEIRSSEFLFRVRAAKPTIRNSLNISGNPDERTSAGERERGDTKKVGFGGVDTASGLAIPAGALGRPFYHEPPPGRPKFFKFK